MCFRTTLEHFFLSCRYTDFNSTILLSNKY
nr:MAG TPA: hypothetical protein [Caudoviricetes sp.]